MPDSIKSKIINKAEFSSDISTCLSTNNVRMSWIESKACFMQSPQHCQATRTRLSLRRIKTSLAIFLSSSEADKSMLRNGKLIETPLTLGFGKFFALKLPPF
ncbi:MAG: hypothetical protein OEZ31_11270 [Nitrospirota bacterium]|nr:hypothetical protein [Nitrospirota bacterium]